MRRTKLLTMMIAAISLLAAPIAAIAATPTADNVLGIENITGATQGTIQAQDQKMSPATTDLEKTSAGADAQINTAMNIEGDTGSLFNDTGGRLNMATNTATDIGQMVNGDFVAFTRPLTGDLLGSLLSVDAIFDAGDAFREDSLGRIGLSAAVPTFIAS